MSHRNFEMSNEIDAVDPMVLTLREEVEADLTDDTRFRFEICITEILANLVNHAQTKISDAAIKISLSVKPGSASIEIFDPIGAKPFDIREYATDLSQVDAMAEGGRGLGLIMECADEVKYSRSGDRNSLRLEFWDESQTETNELPLNGASE